jgi:hypothetical protein
MDPEQARYSTKCTQIAQFLEIHSGPNHEVHVKYAEVLNVVFVTLMYGPGLPVLYIIAVVHYFVYWNVARYSVVYQIQQPPHMGLELTQKCLHMLRFAPLLYLCNAYWMLSNQQIFSGRLLPRDSSDMPMPSGHTLLSTLVLCQSTPLLLLCIASACIFVLQRYCRPQLERFGF